MLNIPATRKTQVRGPLACTQARKEPVPESFVFVTSITAPPRPPTEAAPPPAAPGNAGQFDPLQEALEDVGGGAAAVMVRAAEAVLLESALLVAVTVSEPAFVGAVYIPDELIAPNAAVHVTDLSVIVP
jgi:hypothetical protein